MRLNILTEEKNYWWIIAAIAVITFIPFLGETLFNTKGEPREAIVAVSMLQQDNWILPESCGGDIPYKPPFFAWCIAIASSIFGGEVTEFTSRLPSAIAMIITVMTGFCFFRKRSTPIVAFVMALVTMTAFEVHRAATACRVDMVLTMFIVTSLYALYRHHQRGANGISWLAILLMSGGVLTKGPIAVGLPCMVIGVYRLVQGDRFWRVFINLAISGILACVIPALWYIAAYGKGGDTFLNLALEENFGRLTGKMSYDSHVNPWYYNVITVVSGYAPYTLLLLFSLFGLSWKLRKPENKPTSYFSQPIKWLRSLDQVKLFSLLSIVLIFVFYCIPKSKRSVYLLPIYPFLAYYITLFILWLARNGKRAVRVYAWVISSLSLIVAVAFLLIKCGLIPAESFGAKNAMFITGLNTAPVTIITVILFALLCAVAVATIRACTRYMPTKALMLTLFTTIVLYWNFSACLQPAVLNAKSDYDVALILDELAPQGNVYSFIDDPFLRFYTINFYIGDRVKLFEKEMPASGYIIVGEKDMELLSKKHSCNYTFTKAYRSDKKGCDLRQYLLLLKFNRKQQCPCLGIKPSQSL